MDVNEQIVATWAEMSESLFLRTELYFGNHHHDIDLLGVSLKDGEIWDIEVKARTGTTNMKESAFDEIVKNFQNTEREQVIKGLIGDSSYKYKRVLVISDSYLGSTYENRNKWSSKFKDQDIKVVFFSKVMKDLKEISGKCKKSTNPIIQTLRLSI